jgi:hypothetical protein
MSKNFGWIIAGILAFILIFGFVAVALTGGIAYTRLKQYVSQLHPQPLPENLPEVECPAVLLYGQDCTNLWNCCKEGYSCAKPSIFSGYQCVYNYPVCQNFIPVNWTIVSEYGETYTDVEKGFKEWEKYYTWYELLNGKYDNTNPVDYAYEMVAIDDRLTDFPCRCDNGQTQRFVYVSENTIGKPSGVTPFNYMYCFQNQ